LLFSRFSFWQIQTERILKNKTVETHSYELKDFRLQTGLRPGPWAKSVRRSLDPNQVLKPLHLQCKARCPRCTDAAHKLHTHTHRLHTCCTRWRTYSRSSRSTRSRNFKESFRAILEGFKNALQSKQVHNSRNFKGVKKFTAANPDREDSAKQNSLTARSRNSFLWVEGVEVALPKGISRGSTRVLSAS